MAITIEDLKSGKVPLKFGDIEQIKLINSSEETTYVVAFEFSGYVEVEVKANSKKEAEKIALEMPKDYSPDDVHIRDIYVKK